MFPCRYGSRPGHFRCREQGQRGARCGPALLPGCEQRRRGTDFVRSPRSKAPGVRGETKEPRTRAAKRPREVPGLGAASPAGGKNIWELRRAPNPAPQRRRELRGCCPCFACPDFLPFSRLFPCPLPASWLQPQREAAPRRAQPGCGALGLAARGGLHGTPRDQGTSRDQGTLWEQGTPREQPPAVPRGLPPPPPSPQIAAALGVVQAPRPRSQPRAGLPVLPSGP